MLTEYALLKLQAING
jgi:hypothetical protein